MAVSGCLNRFNLGMGRQYFEYLINGCFFSLFLNNGRFRINAALAHKSIVYYQWLKIVGNFIKFNGINILQTIMSQRLIRL